MVEFIVFIAAFAALLAALVYIRSMVRGVAKPNRVTWLMWSIAPFIATAAALSNGVGWAVLPVFISGFMPLLILISSFFIKNAYWKLSSFDYFCGVLSVMALIFWYITQEPNSAIILAIASDGFAAIPTLGKAWKYAETESVWPFAVGLFNALAAFTAVELWAFSEYAFPTYLVVLNSLFILAIYRRHIRL